MAKQIRLLIVDDNAPLAAEISAFMNAQQEIEVVGTAENAREALEMVKLVHPNAIVADLIMPQTDGFFLLEKLPAGNTAQCPRLSCSRQSVAKVSMRVRSRWARPII